MLKIKSWRAAGLLLAAGCITTVQAPRAQPAEPPPMQAVRLAGDERVPMDGRLTHPVWSRAPAYGSFVLKDPELGAVPPHPTRVQLLYDEQALYIGIDALDDQPDRIRAPLVRHDGVNRTQDFVAVYLDGVGSRQSAQFFRVNAAGSTADGMHTHADDHEDFAPDFDFDAAVHRHAGGWSAVMRIPFASLRFPHDAQRPWRIMVVRRMPREQFMLMTSVLVAREAPSFIANLQQVQGLRTPRDHGLLSLRPSLTLRREHRTEAGVGRDDGRVHASLDIKWRPWAELVVDATLNPDFSQVALDVPQLRGNTQFALALAEKRPFFFESSDLLRAPGGALYTRSFTEPRAGLRATWRGEHLAGTAFAIDDRGGGLTLLPGPFGTGAVTQPASRTLALRAAGDAGADLQWGLLAVQRSYRDSRGVDLGHNRVIGPDLVWQIDPAWRLKALWLGASTSAQPTGSTLAEGAAREGQRRLVAASRAAQGASTDLTLEDVDASFRHDTAFVVQNGVRVVDFHQGWGWFDMKPLNQLWFNLNAYQSRERGSGVLVQEYVTPGLWMQAPGNLELELQWRGHSLLRSRPDAPLLRERYLKADLSFSPWSWMPLVNAGLSLGRLADLGDLGDPADDRVRPGARVSITPRLRPLPRLELEPQWSAAWLRADGGGTAYVESAAQLLGVWHADAHRTLRAIVQRSRLERAGVPLWSDRSLSLTYAWRATAGSVLYIGASRSREPLAGTRGHEVFVKLQVDVDDLRQGRIRW